MKCQLGFTALVVSVNPSPPASPAARHEDALHRHDVRGGGEQPAVGPVLQAARRRGPLAGGGLEALQVRQEQPGEDGHAGRGVRRRRVWPLTRSSAAFSDESSDWIWCRRRRVPRGRGGGVQQPAPATVRLSGSNQTSRCSAFYL